MYILFSFVLVMLLILYFKNINKIKVIQYENGNYGVIKRNWWLRTQFFCFCNVNTFEYLRKRGDRNWESKITGLTHCQEHNDLNLIKKVLLKNSKNNYKVIDPSFILSPPTTPDKVLISESFE